MKSAIAALTLLMTAPFAPADAQQVDMDVMMKWAAADVVKYHIEGIYEAKTYIASDGSGQADISDRVVIDLTWKLSEMKLFGQPTFQNAKSVATNLSDREPGCLPPVLKGEYEHYELLGIKEGLGGTLELTVSTTYPEVEVAQSCTATRKAVPANTKTRPEELVIISPVTLAMSIPDSDDLRITNDKQSLVAKKNGWTWTYTPSIVQQ